MLWQAQFVSLRWWAWPDGSGSIGPTGPGQNAVLNWGHERRRCSAAAERCALLQRCHRRRLPPPHTKEDLKMKRIAALLGALALFAMTAPAVVAAPGPTGDEGLIGAKNMANSNALPGMQNAMSV